MEKNVQTKKSILLLLLTVIQYKQRYTLNPSIVVNRKLTAWAIDTAIDRMKKYLYIYLQSITSCRSEFGRIKRHASLSSDL
jgi:hypothetical protein